MANTYNITNSRGTLLVAIAEGQRDATATSLVLHGRGAPEYGLQRDQNLVYLLENFSSATAPEQPLDGQLWWETGTDTFYVWNESLGSPVGSGDWELVIPPSSSVGFNITAGDGLTGGGFPTDSPLGTQLDVGAGTGITVTADAVSTNDSQIVHNNLSGYEADRHVAHSSVNLTAGAGLTGGGDISASRTFNVGAGDGITVNANDVAVDSTVVRTAGLQSIAGIKRFTSAIEADFGLVGAPGISFDGDTDTGLFRSNVNEISFATGGTQRFRMESNGVLRSLNSTYETLVTDDDDIPNKKYVDDEITAAVSAGSVYAGYVDASATAERVPSGWSAVRLATGRFRVTHNLGLAAANRLSVVAMAQVPSFGAFQDITTVTGAFTTNTFEVHMWTGGTGAGGVDRPFSFLATLN